ncbi:MAG TPA: hypothetical protein VFK85_04535 [Anaeromyxobacteraceae bacterium]|nr:hypothetical protein [Anaeromyxobacteraceae bacterium]
MTDLADPLWLALLVDDSLASLATRERRGDAVAALATDPLTAFLTPVREDIDALSRSPAAARHRDDGAWLRAFVASVLAARAGEVALAIAADPNRPHRRSIAAVRRALEVTGGATVERWWPPADPRGGLPLRSGLLAIERGHLERLAADHHAGRFTLVRLRRRVAQAQAESALLFETLASWLLAGGALPAGSNRIVLQQLKWLRLRRSAHQRARTVLAEPRAPRELARNNPPRLRRLTLDQLLLAEVACGAEAPRQTDFIDAFAEECGISHDDLPALRTVAAARCAASQRWLEPRASTDADALAREWEAAAERMYTRVADAFSDNLEALVTEVRETGELGQLLGRAASGHTLTPVERAKVKAQLIDLAKVVPALAIFAAPGGMLLLPLLSKLLPFNMLPSAWAHAKPARLPAGATKK